MIKRRKLFQLGLFMHLILIYTLNKCFKIINSYVNLVFHKSIKLLYLEKVLKKKSLSVIANYLEIFSLKY